LEISHVNNRFPTLLLLGGILFVGCQTSSNPPGPTRKVHSAELNELTKRYSQSAMIRSEASVEAREWDHVEYGPLVVASAQGDEKALHRMLKLRLDGAGGEEHAQNLLDLMKGLGDQAFTSALKQCSAKERAEVLSDLDIEVNQKKYPLTFRLKPSD
jgi:hypothetical protein